MRPPATAILGHLAWSRSGRVWAVWRVQGSPYVWLPNRRKLAEHGRVRTLLSSLPPESMILSVAARIDAAEVADAMAQGVDLSGQPGWGDAVEATLDRLEDAGLYRRQTYLCALLPHDKTSKRWLSTWRSASGSVLRGWGLAPPPIPVREVTAAQRQAAELHAELSSLHLTPVSAGELRWLYARAARRGLPDEPFLAGWQEPTVRKVNGSIASPSLAPLLDGRFNEGGIANDPDRPRHRRYLRVETDEGVSYQTFATVADAPQQFTFPGGLSEWLFVADQLPFPVDWACRIKAVPNPTATRAATRQQRELVGQVPEYDAEIAGPPPSLAAAIDAVDDERASLAANPSEPELQVSMTFATWAPTLAELEQQARTLQRVYHGAEYHMPRPTGGQLALFESMLPGAPTPQPCNDYRQYMLPRDLAAGMPFTSSHVGDTTGMLLGVSRDAGCARPILLDPASGPRHDRDGSIAAFGALGSGKSYLAKRLASTVLLRGGKMVLIDRTQAGEYVRFAAAMSEAGVRTQVVTVSEDGGLLLDPLRVFGARTARQVALGYLGMVCGVDPTSLEAATLDKAVGLALDRSGATDTGLDSLPSADRLTPGLVAPAAQPGHDLSVVPTGLPDTPGPPQLTGTGARLQDVLAELDRLGDDGVRTREHRYARDLALRLRTIANNRFGAPAWGEGPSIDTTADCTVIHLPNLAVPRREVLLSEHLSRRLLPEQVCSLGLLYLVAALARGITFDEQNRFAALCMDEAWALTFTLPGQQLLDELLRDGRKHNAAGWVFSQNPDDLPPELRSLISVRFIFGLNGDAAVSGLEWLGVDASQHNLDVLEHWAARRAQDTSTETTATHASTELPECLVRDAAGRVGCVQVLDAETELLRTGFESNPTRVAAASSSSRT